MGEGWKRAVAAARATQPAKRKYKNKPVTDRADGLRFASQAEARRYDQLVLLMRGRKIGDLQRQPPFPLVVNGQKICTYVGDFLYYESDQLVVEDVKSPATARERAYRIKVKLLKVLYPRVEHREVFA